MARRLATIAKHINENVRGLEAKIERSYTSTDSNYAGTRIRKHGKGRYGNKLTVCVEGHPEWIVFEHDASQTYRSNDEVEYWLGQWENQSRTIPTVTNRQTKKADILSGKYFRKGGG